MAQTFEYLLLRNCEGQGHEQGIVFKSFHDAISMLLCFISEPDAWCNQTKELLSGANSLEMDIVYFEHPTDFPEGLVSVKTSPDGEPYAVCDEDGEAHEILSYRFFAENLL